MPVDGFVVVVVVVFVVVVLLLLLLLVVVVVVVGMLVVVGGVRLFCAVVVVPTGFAMVVEAEFVVESCCTPLERVREDGGSVIRCTFRRCGISHVSYSLVIDNSDSNSIYIYNNLHVW